MNEQLKARILAYNREMAARKEKAADLQILADALCRLPYGQLKKLLTEEVLGVLGKYGLEVRENE